MKAMKRVKTLARLTVVALVVAAVATELSKPTEQRTWHGKVGGIVPYDFRLPTWERIRSAYWNPDSNHLFSDRAFGVGWALNLHRAKVLLGGLFQRLMGTYEPQTTIRMAHPAESPARGAGASAQE